MWSFLLVVHGYVLAGSEVIEVAALTCEAPQTIQWDGTDEERRSGLVVDWQTRKARHPGYWTVMPCVLDALASGKVPAPRGWE